MQGKNIWNYVIINITNNQKMNTVDWPCSSVPHTVNMIMTSHMKPQLLKHEEVLSTAHDCVTNPKAMKTR